MYNVYCVNKLYLVGTIFDIFFDFPNSFFKYEEKLQKDQ